MSGPKSGVYELDTLRHFSLVIRAHVPRPGFRGSRSIPEPGDVACIGRKQLFLLRHEKHLLLRHEKHHLLAALRFAFASRTWLGTLH